MIIFDEATSAIDPNKEEEIFEKLKIRFKDQILIFVSHKKNLIKYSNKKIIIKNNKVEMLNS